MNKKLIYGLCAASFLMTACDYNEDNFPGFDQELQAVLEEIKNCVEAARPPEAAEITPAAG